MQTSRKLWERPHHQKAKQLQRPNPYAKTKVTLASKKSYIQQWLPKDNKYKSLSNLESRSCPENDEGSVPWHHQIMRQLFDDTVANDWTLEEIRAARDNLLEACWDQHGIPGEAPLSEEGSDAELEELVSLC